MTSIILHHYDTSPYAEKVRTGLGLKGLAWASVELPVIMPKPNPTALTMDIGIARDEIDYITSHRSIDPRSG
jgi:hypothetical protein